jgi:glycosyltransferase involved in cell wall biosynthesis
LVGDVGEIIRRFRVGVVVQENSASEMQRAAADLAGLLRDPDLTRRCRAAAEEWFSLDQGAERYDALYRKICP